MPAIVLSNCSICLKDHTGYLSKEEREKLADPDCPRCQGSGYYESEEDRQKRLIEQRGCDDVLDKMDAMDDAGLDYDSMSDEEFKKWKIGDAIPLSRAKSPEEIAEQKQRSIEDARMEEGNKFARYKLRQIRRNLNSFERRER